MAQFAEALTYVLNFEDPRREYRTLPDNKGQVIAGVNSLAWPIEFGEIDELAPGSTARAQAVANFYQAHFWEPMRLGGLTSQEVANRVLDTGVNTGPKMGVEMLQKALILLNPAALGGAIGIDGLMGPLTLGAANEVDPESLLAAIRTERVAYYQRLVAADPSDQPYLAGWLARATA